MIIYSPNYKKENTTHWAIHHTGGLGQNQYASTRLLTADNIDKAHKARWNYKSSLGYFSGYNFFIDFQGNITQFRAIGEETMAQKGYNFDGKVISICLAGNFTKGIDMPTKEQEIALRELYKQLPQVAPYNIVPHRKLSSTDCFGTGLKDDWARNVILDRATQFSIMMQMLSNMMDILRKLQNKSLGKLLGSVGPEDDCHL